MAPPKRKNPHPDSMAANPAASRLLTRLVATGVIKSGDKAISKYRHPNYCRSFAPADPEKFRRRLRKLLAEKYGKVVKEGLFTYFFLCLIIKLVFQSFSSDLEIAPSNVIE